MSGVNKVIILGNLGQDPEVKFMPSGEAVANISIATSEEWKDKTTGEAKSKVEWHRVVMFGKLAEITGEYLKKGSKVYIEGALQTRKWQNQQGQDQYTTEIVVKGFGGKMEMLDSRQQGQQSAPQQQSGFQQQTAPKQGGFANNQQQAPRDANGFTQAQGGFQQQAAPQQQGGYQQQGGFNQQGGPQQGK
tara:strand:+ start:449 stop:1018 length:570 start_codon:yes stop_codon:yes gene_type:complete